MTTGAALTGGCLCDAVRFRVEGPLPAPIACHCDQCRRRSGHFAVCGRQFFWERTVEPEISIEVGAFDGSTGLRLAVHIFTAETGDYYDITDGLPTAPHDRGDLG